MKIRAEAGVGQPGDDVAGIALDNADVGEALLVDVAKRAGDAVQERLDADDQHVRPPRRLGRHVLAAAEADLQPGLGRSGMRARGSNGPSGTPSRGSSSSSSAAWRGFSARVLMRP